MLSKVAKLQEIIESKDHLIAILKEQIKYLTGQRFSPKTEQTDKLQLELFVIYEQIEKLIADTAETDQEITVPSHTRTKKGGRTIPPEHLPRTRVEHDLSESEKQCNCGCTKQRCGEETSYQYDVIPAKFQVIENVRIKYSCTNPSCNEAPKTAKMDPPAPLPGTQASSGTIAWVATNKFSDGLDLNRIAKIAQQRFEVPFSSTTLASWMIKAADRLIDPLVGAMAQVMDRTNYIHIDETTLQVLNEEGREAKQKSYIWCRVTGVNAQTPIVIMTYSYSRAGAIATELLQDFKGYIQTDGYPGYNATAQREDITQLGCWVHVRRKFDVAAKNSQDGAKEIAQKGMSLISRLFYLDKQAKDKPPDEKLLYRQQIVEPHLDKMKNWLENNFSKAKSYGGLLATAFTYITNQWVKLIVFIKEPYLELDNNRAERHIRPIATGRKVWLFANSEQGARATALWFSLIETAKANNLEPYWYLKMVCEQMPIYLRDEKPVDDLLPWNVDAEEIKPD